MMAYACVKCLLPAYQEDTRNIMLILTSCQEKTRSKQDGVSLFLKSRYDKAILQELLSSAQETGPKNS